MKNSWKKLTALMIAFLAIGCTSVSGDVSAPDSNKPSGQSSKVEDKTSTDDGDSSDGGSSSSTHEHKYATTWSYDDNNHWKACTVKDCRNVSEYGAHTWGEWATVDPSTLSGAAKYAYVLYGGLHRPAA